jgi:hypothetical protein
MLFMQHLGNQLADLTIFFLPSRLKKGKRRLKKISSIASISVKSKDAIPRFSLAARFEEDWGAITMTVNQVARIDAKI